MQRPRGDDPAAAHDAAAAARDAASAARHEARAARDDATAARAATIGEVIDALGEVVADARRRGDRIGLFAALYRRTTEGVRDGIEAGRFDDPARMERLDVVFAERYFAAYDAHRRGETPAGPWRYAFARAAEDGHLALQHLLLGVNAHIALDLGVSACATCGPGALRALEHDFFVINDILAEMVDRVQRDLNAVSPRMASLDRLGGPADERLAAAFLARARRAAWRKALRYDAAPPERRAPLLRRWDDQVTRVARRICPPAERIPPATRRLLAWIGEGESGDLSAVLDAIEGA